MSPPESIQQQILSEVYIKAIRSFGGVKCNLSAILPIHYPSPEREERVKEQSDSQYMIRGTREEDERDNNWDRDRKGDESLCRNECESLA